MTDKFDEKQAAARLLWHDILRRAEKDRLHSKDNTKADFAPRSNATMRLKAALFWVCLSTAQICPVAHADPAPLPTHAQSRFERVRPILDKAAAILDEEGVPRYFIFLALAESGGDPGDVSPRGAAGLWQLMPSTARAYGIAPAERTDAEKSTRAAARYIRHLLDMFDNDYLWAVAAYNAGGHNLKKATGYKPGMSIKAVKAVRPAAYALAMTVKRLESENHGALSE